MTEFPLERRNLLRATGAGLLGTGCLSRRSVAQSTSGGDLIWKFYTGGTVISSPTVVNGDIYVGSWEGSVYALDADSGGEEWEFETDSLVGSSPTVVEETVYIGSNDNSVYAVDSGSGEEVWEFETGGAIRSSPTVVDGTVFVGSWDDSIYAVDAESGEAVWAFDTDNRILSSPTVVGGTVFVGSGNASLWAVGAESGGEEWEFDTGWRVQSSPTVVDGTVFVGSGDSSMYAVDVESGEEEWEFDTYDNNVYSSPTVVDGTVFVGSNDGINNEGRMYAVDVVSGEEIWAFNAGDRVKSSPTVADGLVFFGSFDNNVYAVDEGSGEVVWTFDTGNFVESSPTVVDGTVYVGSNDGNVYALDAGVEGSSDDSRVNLGTLGHHHGWTGTDPSPETGTVTGTVTTETGDSLAGVSVEFVATESDTVQETVTTDSDGSYEVEVPAGHYEGIVDAEGFSPMTRPVAVEANTTHELSFEFIDNDPSVSISELEVSPHAVLRNVETDIVFAVAVEPESDVSVSQVEIQQDAFIAPMEGIQEIPNETLVEYLDWFGLTIEIPPTAPDALVEEVFELLLDGASAENIYAATLSTAGPVLSVGENEFEVRATGSDGTLTTRSVFLPQYEPGDRLKQFNTAATGPDVAFYQEFFDFGYDVAFGDSQMPNNLPILDEEVLYDIGLSYSGEGILDLNTLETTPVSRSIGGVNVLGEGVEFQMGGAWEGGTDVYTYELAMQHLWLAGLISFPIPIDKFKFTLPDNPYVEDVGVDLDGVPGGYLLVGDLDPATPLGSATESTSGPGYPSPETQEHGMYFTLAASAGASGVVEVFLEGELHAATGMDLPDGAFNPPVGDPLVLQGGAACLDGGLTVGDPPFGMTISISTLADHTEDFSQPCLALGETREPPCWELFNLDQPCQTYPAAGASAGAGVGLGGITVDDADIHLVAPTGQHPPAGSLTSETDTAVATRLTDRPERDTSPDIAVRETDHLAVWARQPAGEPADYGSDIVTAIRDDAGGWGDPTPLASGAGLSYNDPAVAVDATGTVAVAWTRYDLEGAEQLEAVGPMTRIEVTLDTGDGWSDPVVVADSDAWFDRRPAVEPLGDGWLVAWERTDPADAGTRALGYAVIDATGAVARTETIANAAQHDLAPGNDGVILGYYDRTAQQVRRDIVTTTDRLEDAVYEVAAERSLRALAVSGSGTVWVTDGSTTTAGFYAEGDAVEALDFVTAASRLRGLALQETAAGQVLTYARVPADDVRARTLAYRLRTDGEWRPEQVPATADASADVVVRAPTTVPSTDGTGLVTVLGAKEYDPDAVQDVFAVTQPLRPNYSISADTDAAVVPPGEELTVAYTIENTGDLDGSAIDAEDVLVEARSQGTTLAAQAEAPLDTGATSSGTLTVTVDDTGTLDIVVGRELDLLDPADRRTTIEASTPSLVLESVSVDRPDAAMAVATVSIGNRGLVDAGEFQVEVSTADGTLLHEAVVPGLAAGEQQTVVVEYDPSELAFQQGERLDIDPDETLPDSHVPARTVPVLLGQPALIIDDEIGYSETTSGALATLALTNAGPVSTQVVVRAVWADAIPEDGSFADDDLLGTTTVTLPAAIEGTPQQTTVDIGLTGVAYADEIRFVVDSDRPVAGAGVPVVYDRVGPFDSTVEIPALPGYEAPPQDLDGDGLFEDVDGDGKFDIFDVQALFTHLNSDPIQANPEAFNFNGDDDPDEVTIFDLQGLFDQLQAWDGAG